MNIVLQNHTEYHMVTEVYASDGKHQICTISKYSGFGDNDWTKPVDINWSAWGSQTIDITKEFAEGLKYAISLAQEYDKLISIYEVVYEIRNIDGNKVETRRMAASDVSQINGIFNQHGNLNIIGVTVLSNHCGSK